jgi:hypothetical protein
MVATVPADEFEQPAACCGRVARGGAKRLAAEHRQQAVAGLARLDHYGIRSYDASPPAVVRASPLATTAACAAGRPLAGERVRAC